MCEGRGLQIIWNFGTLFLSFSFCDMELVIETQESQSLGACIMHTDLIVKWAVYAYNVKLILPFLLLLGVIALKGEFHRLLSLS